jgi:hypothetical protein
MTTPSGAESRSAKLKNSFSNLSKASQELNTASEVFGTAVTSLEDAINALNPGVAAWVAVSSSSPDEDMPWQSVEERLGYDKVDGRWGLALSTVEIDSSGDVSESVQASWRFKDAPRSLRLRAIDRVPELIEALAREASRTAKRVGEQADYATSLAEAISAIASEGGIAR